MHEKTATRAILHRVLQQAGGRHAGRITDVHVALGAVSKYSEERVRFHWAELSKGTIAEGARLHFRTVPVELQCMACFTKYRPQEEEILCPRCGSSGAKVLAGEEFYVESLDVA